MCVYIYGYVSFYRSVVVSLAGKHITRSVGLANERCDVVPYLSGDLPEMERRFRAYTTTYIYIYVNVSRCVCFLAGPLVRDKLENGFSGCVIFASF